jgi:mono/diheme cytochrome c family protein
MSFRKASLWISGGGALVLIFASGFNGSPTAQAGPTRTPPGKKTAKTTAQAQKALTGAALFADQCAPCHGKKGEGTEAYSRSLTGNLTVAQLAKYIATSMPPGPKKCTSPDAQKIAPYIYDAFYSPIAQERSRPARVSLSRLTVRQLRNSTADLLASFRQTPPKVEGEGLQAEYFKAKRFQDADRVIQRVDPSVNFDFGTQGPSGAEFQPHQFSIRWTGSVTAPDTGMYEFVVRTEHGLRLWVNDRKKPVIDASVKSGNDEVYRTSVFLISGRSYPIRLEFSKSTQGVDDTKKKEGKPAPKASISLAWKRPKQAEEIIPARCLSPGGAADAFVLTTPFPPDDRSMGYEIGNTISKEWDEATTAAALETADYVVNHLSDYVKNTDDPAMLKPFCRKFVERALRRPLDDATAKLYIEKQFAATPDVKTAVKRVVLLTMKSPRFLYRELDGTSADAYNVASRLSYTLWDSIPDDALLKAAATNTLSTREQVKAQAERMLADPRAWDKQREFFHQWLKVDQYPDLTKDAARFPTFTASAATDLRTSLDLELQNVVNSPSSDYRQLLLSDKVYLNGRLAKIYGVNLPADAPFQPVALDPTARAGVLTHPYLLSSFSYIKTSSPIHRGVLLARNIMGRTLQPPPAAFAPLAADLHPKLTTRQRVALQTKPPTCMSCHSMINPLGFSLERFDAIGRFRNTENGQPVDASGGYTSKDGKTVKFTGSRDLAKFVATSDEAHAAFVEKLFQYSVKQPIRAYGPQTLPMLKKDFEENQYNIRQLVAEIATTAALPKAGTGKGAVARGEG